MEYNEEEFLNLGASYDGEEGKSEMHIIDISKEEEESILVENAELEAKFVAKRIKELIKDGYQVQVKEGKRNITYKDIVILMRAVNGVADIYERVLSEQQIPVFSDCDGSYLETREIKTILSLLKIIDNPDQDIDLVAVMRSNIGNFTDNELVEIRLCDKIGTFYDALQKAKVDTQKELKTKVENFLYMLKQFQDMQEYTPFHELVWYIYNKTGYYDYISVLPNGVQKIANLKLLFEKAKEYETASFKGLYNFINFIEKLQKKGHDMGAAKIIGENDDVVRIMSIHKSKGLEFPVVFICGMGKQFNLRELNDDIILHQELGFGPKFIDTELNLQYSTLAKEAIKVKAKTEAISEEMRVLYVALTRAKEKLIMVGTKKEPEKDMAEKEEQLKACELANKIPKGIVKSGKSYLDWMLLTSILRKEEMQKELEITIHNKNEFMGEEEQEEKEEFKIWTVSNNVSKQVLEKLTWEYPYASSCKIPSKSSVTKLKQEEIKVPEAILCMPKFLSKESKTLSGAQKGTIMHKTLQTLDLKRNYEKEDISEHIQKLVSNNILTMEEAESVKQEKLLLFTKSALADQIRRAKEIQKEKPFYLELQAKRFFEHDVEDSILIQGIIDLYFRDEHGKLVLVDYKTDYVENEEELVKKYSNQLEIYKEAIEKATGEKVEKCYIYSLYLNKEISVIG